VRGEAYENLVAAIADGKTVIPQLVPIVNNSFTVDGKTWKW